MSDDAPLALRGFAKLDCGIVDSSLWLKDHDVLRVWIAMLAKCDSLGRVRAAAPNLARLCFVSVERFEAIVAELEAPDPHSRTSDHDGRRIRRVEGGYVIINYLRYRELSQRKEGSHAERQARYRARLAERDGREQESVTRDAVTSPEYKRQRQRQREEERVATASLPPALDTPEFRAAWSNWLTYRRERKLTAWQPRTVAAKLAECEQAGTTAAVAAIRDSIGNGYQGFWPLKFATKAKAAGPALSAGDYGAENRAAWDRKVRRAKK